MKHFFTSSSTGEFCVAKTMWSIFSVMSMAKYAVAELTINGMVMPEFDAVGTAALFAVFTAGYAKRESDKASSLK